MKVSDKSIVFGVLVVVFAIGFYMLALAPKRQKTSELNDQIDQIHASIEQQESVASYAEQARKEFPRYYGRLVVLGKAVPAQADTASMLVQLNSISGQNHLDFRSIELGGDAGSAGTGSSASAAPAATPRQRPARPFRELDNPTGVRDSGSFDQLRQLHGRRRDRRCACARDRSVRRRPSDRRRGRAGRFPTLPYTLKFQGGFFDIANFIGGVDDLVQPTDSGLRLTPDGRLSRSTVRSMVATTAPRPCSMQLRGDDLRDARRGGPDSEPVRAPRPPSAGRGPGSARERGGIQVKAWKVNKFFAIWSMTCAAATCCRSCSCWSRG
jgi:Tfp pilus assembly protein PilO